MRETIIVVTRSGERYLILDASQPHFFQTGSCGTFVVRGKRAGSKYESEFVFWESAVESVETLDAPVNK